MNNVVVLTLIATLGTWFVTALGAAMVVFFRTAQNKSMNIMLGFASGVMIAASFWSLLEPAIERAEESCPVPAYIVATSGFIAGGIFMWLCDKFINRCICNSGKYPVLYGNKGLGRVIMLILSVTLHNIPEGLAVGVAFGALTPENFSAETLFAAISLAVGIGLQNFPEGAAVSLPLKREGFSAKASFLLGQASGMVEPLAGLAGVLLVVYVQAILPYALSFAAGTMILVSVHELIPECQQNKDEKPYSATMGIMAGFAFMMLLDVMLG